MSSDDAPPPPQRLDEDDQTQPGARPVPAPTESTLPGADSATSDLRDFSNIPTSQISSTQLKEQLEEMRRGDEPESTVEEDDRPPTAGLGAKLRGVPKWALAAGACVVLVLLVLPFAMAGPAVVYLSDSHELRSGPAESPNYEAVATLARGARLEVIEADEFWSLVRDAAGRVGYINRTLLTPDKPEATPDYAFADCDSDPRPGGDEACRLRALEQFESCRLGCADDGACLENCQKRLASCGRSCEGQEDKAPEPVGDLAEAAPDDPESTEPGDEPEEAAEPEEAEGKKKRKGKRRRRRKKATADPSP